MAELRPGDGQQLDGDVPPPLTTVVEPPAVSISIGAGVSVGSKRLRRPSVRLGDIGGDQYPQVSYDLQAWRPKWKHLGKRKDPSSAGKSARSQTLMNLSFGYENSGTLDEEREGNVDSMAVGSWRVKRRVGPYAGATTTASTKRVRSNWVSKLDDALSNFDNGGERYKGGEELGDAYRDLSREDSESTMKEQSPGNYMENRNGRDDINDRRKHSGNNSSRIRGLEVSEPSDMEGGSGGRGGREGVKIWLEELGLGRYWAVFEIHEVDEEVLPLLTLEDLKDMGINAVGSRRKMYCAIQKLGREFS